MRELNEIIREHMIARTINWSGLAYPNAGWAEKVFGEPDVERLWEAVAFCTRLDEADPVAAWREHMAKLETRAPAAERAQVRCGPLPRPRHRLHDRAPPERPVDVGAVPHRRGPRVRPEHADRGDLHDSRLAPRRRDDHLDAPARPFRRRDRGPRADGQGRPDRQRRRDARRGDRAAEVASDEEPHGSARSRWSTAHRASARPGSPSSTPCSTRTRPATSPTASGSPRTSTASRTRA